MTTGCTLFLSINAGHDWRARVDQQAHKLVRISRATVLESCCFPIFVQTCFLCSSFNLFFFSFCFPQAFFSRTQNVLFWLSCWSRDWLKKQFIGFQFGNQNHIVVKFLSLSVGVVGWLVGDWYDLSSTTTSSPWLEHRGRRLPVRLNLVSSFQCFFSHLCPLVSGCECITLCVKRRKRRVRCSGLFNWWTFLPSSSLSLPSWQRVFWPTDYGATVVRLFVHHTTLWTGVPTCFFQEYQLQEFLFSSPLFLTKDRPDRMIFSSSSSSTLSSQTTCLLTELLTPLPVLPFNIPTVKERERLECVIDLPDHF